MNQERLTQLIHEQTAAIDALEGVIGTHETIRRLLRWSSVSSCLLMLSVYPTIANTP